MGQPEQDQGIEERARKLCMGVVTGGLTHFRDGTPIYVEGCPVCVKILAALKAEQEIGRKRAGEAWATAVSMKLTLGGW